MKPIDTRVTYKDFKNNVFHEGVKKKFKNFDMKNITTVELINAETGELEVSETCENVVKNKTSYPFEQFYVSSLAEPTRETTGSTSMGAYSNTIGIDQLRLYNDSSTVKESEKEKYTLGDLIGYAYNYSTYSGSDELRGSVHLNGTYVYEDPVRKARVYSTLWEFPTHACNGTINKVALQSEKTNYAKRDVLSTYWKENCRSNKYLALELPDQREGSMFLRGTDIYQIRNWENHKTTGTCSLEKYDLSVLKGGKDPDTGEYITNVVDTQETIFSNKDVHTGLWNDASTYTNSNEWKYGKKGWALDKHATYLYSAFIYEKTKLRIMRIRLSDGVEEEWLNLDLTLDMHCATYSNLELYSETALHVDEDKDKLYLVAGGSGEGTNDAGSYDDRKTETGVWIYELSTKTRLKFNTLWKVSEGTIKSQLTTILDSSKDNPQALLPHSIIPSADGGVMVRCSAYKSSSSYNLSMVNAYLYGDNLEKVILNPISYVQSHNYAYAVYGAGIENRTYIHTIDYDPIGEVHYGYGSGMYFIGFEPENPITDAVLMENTLPTPITKTTNHLLRVRYEVLIPWKTGEYNLSDYVEWNG